MIYFVDIDGTICESRVMKRIRLNDPTISYEDVNPYFDRIEQINKLYDEGNEIVYWTGRGVATGEDWTELTTKQLEKWGCKYHKLITNDKPHFDMYICDKSFNSEIYFDNENILETKNKNIEITAKLFYGMDPK